MSKVSPETIGEALDSSVAVYPERRGFAKIRGVPDSVFWLAPASDDFRCRPLPVLVELEGGFADATDDFAKFAERYEDEDYQYHIEWPTIAAAGPEPVTRTTEYAVTGIRANQLTDSRSITEREMHTAFTDWFEQFSPKFRTSTRIQKYGSTVIVEWQIQFTMFGREFSTSVPFIVEPGSNIEQILSSVLPSPTVPSVVVINDKYDGREAATYYHETTIEFPSIHPIRFQ